MHLLFANKGWSARPPQEQVALCVRVYRGRHARDVEQQVRDMLGERRAIVGRVDMTRNPLRSACDRVNRAYQRPPLVTGITPALLAGMGDASSSVAVRRYTEAGGLPMPTTQQAEAREALGLYLAAGYSGLMVGWSARRQRVTVQAIAPDDLSVEYSGDDPIEPTVIEHARQRWQGDRYVSVRERYDLRDIERPVYSVRTVDGDDLTPADVAAQDGWPSEWRLADGRPIHRIAILGRPGQPYGTLRLVEASLRVPALWSHWSAAIVDAGHPSRHAMGLRAAGASSDARSGQQGQAGGPEAIHLWDHVDPERPGSIMQLGPGYDPKVSGEAITAYEMAAQTQLGLPLLMSSTGGDPVAQEEEAAERAAAVHYPALRMVDAHVLQVAECYLALHQQRRPVDIRAGILYGDEVEAALEPPDPVTAAGQTTEDSPDA